MGEKLFAGSCSGVVYAINKNSGEAIWTYDTRQDSGPAQFHGDPAIAGDVFITGSDTAEPSFVYAFKMDDGTLLWKKNTDVLESDIVAAGGVVVGQTFFGDFVALDPDTGDRRWKLTANERKCGRRPKAPAASRQTVFVAASDGTIRALRASDGKEKWSHNSPCVSTGLKIVRGRLWAGSGPSVWSRSLDTGRELSSVDIGGNGHGSLVVAGKSATVVLQVGQRDVVAVHQDGKAIRWRYRADHDLTSPRPHAYGELVIVGGKEGQVIAIDADNGAVRWQGSVEGTVRGIGSDAGRLYIGTLQGNIYGFRPPSQ